MSSNVFIMPHQGLGDHIVCSALYRIIAYNNDLCVIPVFKKNYKAVKQLLADVDNIQVLTYQDWWPTIEPHRDLLEKLGFEILNLGGFREKGIQNGMRFDAWFYAQANVSFNERWDSFYLERNFEKEDLLFKKLVPSTGKYIFVHEDRHRGYTLDRTRLPKHINIVSANPNLAKKFTPFDYFKIIENAEQIHCIESSFAAFIESTQISIKKFAHRYARPEAKSDYQQEFTYRTDWEKL